MVILGYTYGSDNLLDVYGRDNNGATTWASNQQPINAYVHSTSKILCSKILEYYDSEGFSGTHNFSGNSGLTFPTTFSVFSRRTLDNSKVYLDWVFVRKYSSTEPSVSVTNQGTYYEVEITNTGTSDLNDYQVAIPISTVKYQPFEIVEAEPSPEVKKRNVIINGNVF